MKIKYKDFEIEIIDEPLHEFSSNENPQNYSKEYLLGEDHILAPRCGIVIKNANDLENTCIVLANGSGGKVHANSAVMVDNSLFVAIGYLVCCFEIPSLALQWQKQVDGASCFGVYVSPDNKGIISHGELEITKISFSGDILWKATGKDIFTEGFKLFPNHIEAIDFIQEKYKILLSDGQIFLLQSNS